MISHFTGKLGCGRCRRVLQSRPMETAVLTVSVEVRGEGRKISKARMLLFRLAERLGTNVRVTAAPVFDEDVQPSPAYRS